MATVMDTRRVAAAYDRWAPVYDLVFGSVFKRGRSLAIDRACRVGGRVLEVGVGTGISLPAYDGRCRLTGVDISERSLTRARDRVRALGLSNVDALTAMDAERLSFADGSFDVVVAQYVVTAVPHPERALDEFARVVRPGGEIVIATRIGAGHGLRGRIERTLMPLTSRLGFRTEFAWARYANWCDRNGTVELVERSALPPFGHFELIRYRKHGDAA